MRQYFFESETDGLPFSRSQRAIVYQRAKMVLDKRPFGTQRDTNAQGYEFLRHSIAPKPVAKGGRPARGRSPARRPHLAGLAGGKVRPCPQRAAPGCHRFRSARDLIGAVSPVQGGRERDVSYVGAEAPS